MSSSFYKVPEGVKGSSAESPEGGRPLLVKLGKDTRSRIKTPQLPSSPESFEADMDRFFTEHQQFIENSFEGEEKESRLRDLEERKPHLAKMAAYFSTLTSDLNISAIVFSSDDCQKLSEVRAGIDKDFLENLLNFYSDLEKLIKGIVENIQVFGMDYVMSGPDNYNGQMTESLKKAFVHMQSTEALEGQLTPQLQNALVRQTRRRLVGEMVGHKDSEVIKPVPELVEESAYYSMEAQAIIDIVHKLEQETPDTIREKVLQLVQMNLSHMSGALAGQYLPVLSNDGMSELPDGKNALESETSTTPERMEFIFSMINKSVRLLGNVYYIRDNLLVEQPAAEQNAVAAS